MQTINLKKSLIALAALAATGLTFADSGVSLTGVIDVGLKATTNTDSSKNKTELINNNTTTSLLYFKGFRELGDGMTAYFLLESDFNAAQSSTLNTSANGQAFSGTPFNGEQYVAISGGFGDVKLGIPNSAALTAGLTAQPFGTALGSGYAGAFGRLGTAGFAGILNYDGGTSARIVRHEKSVVYTTPAFGGFKAGLEYAFGNDNSATITNNSNTNTTASLQYNNGALNAIYVYSNEKAGSKGAAGTTAALGTAPTVTLPVNTDVTWNMLAANYKFGDFTLLGGYTNTKHNAPIALEDSESWNIAAKYSINPKLEVMGNYLFRDSKLASNADATLYGLGLNYFYDKQTNLYVRYEGIRFAATGAIAAQDQDIWAIGLRYQF